MINRQIQFHNWALFYLDTHISLFNLCSNIKFPFDFTPSYCFPFGFMIPCNTILSITYIEKPFEKQPHTSYDKSQVFKDIQVGQFPWAKFIIWDDGLNTHDVRYKVWSYIGGKDKLFNPKHNTFHKHVSCQNAKVYTFGVVYKIFIQQRFFAKTRELTSEGMYNFL